jgi:hypothetical protein
MLGGAPSSLTGFPFNKNLTAGIAQAFCRAVQPETASARMYYKAWTWRRR